VKKVESGALQLANAALGLTGTSGLARTEFEDGILGQALDVLPIIRRGRTLGATTGLVTMLIRNIHAGAGTISTAITPFVLGQTGLRGPMVSPIPKRFDLFLLNATLRQVSGTGTLSGALFIDFPFDNLGFGIDSAGAAVVAADDVCVAFWDAVTTETLEFGLLQAGGVLAQINLRLPTNPLTRITFSTTASALATFDVNMRLGLFPITLGQDIAV